MYEIQKHLHRLSEVPAYVMSPCFCLLLKIVLWIKSFQTHCFHFYFGKCCVSVWGMWWHSWWRLCATSRKVVGLIPDGVIGIFHWHNPSNHTMDLRSTQPLTEMSTWNFLGGLGSWCLRLTTLPLSCANCREIWESQTPGTPCACPGL